MKMTTGNNARAANSDQDVQMRPSATPGARPIDLAQVINTGNLTTALIV